MKDSSTRRGRPPKGPDARKNTRSTTLSDAELDRLVSRSLVERRPVSDLLRDAAIGPTRGDTAPTVSRRA